MGELAATRQHEAVLPLQIDQPRAQVKPRVQAADKIWSRINAEVVLKYNNVAVVAACATILVTAVAIVVMTLLRLAVVEAILLQV